MSQSETGRSKEEDAFQFEILSVTSLANMSTDNTSNSEINSSQQQPTNNDSVTTTRVTRERPANRIRPMEPPWVKPKKSSIRKKQECHICGQMLYDIPKHVRNIHPERHSDLDFYQDSKITNTSFNCASCSLQFNSKNELVKHQNFTHSDDCTQECDNCSFKFTVASNSTAYLISCPFCTHQNLNSLTTSKPEEPQKSYLAFEERASPITITTNSQICSSKTGRQRHKIQLDLQIEWSNGSENSEQNLSPVQNTIEIPCANTQDGNKKDVFEFEEDPLPFPVIEARDIKMEPKWHRTTKRIKQEKNEDSGEDSDYDPSSHRHREMKNGPSVYKFRKVLCKVEKDTSDSDEEDNEDEDTSSENKKLICKQCGSYFGSEKRYESHLASHVSKHHCLFCNLSFQTDLDLEAHEHTSSHLNTVSELGKVADEDDPIEPQSIQLADLTEENLALHDYHQSLLEQEAPSSIVSVSKFDGSTQNDIPSPTHIPVEARIKSIEKPASGLVISNITLSKQNH